MPSDDILLILDLDETLIFASETPLDREADFIVGHYHVYLRPHLKAFWQAVLPNYQLAIWTTGTDDYAAEIARHIEPAQNTFHFVWGRSKCSWRRQMDLDEYEYEKRLAKLKTKGFRLERMLIVDDTREKCRSNYGNAIYVKPFVGDPQDNELLLLASYLPSLAQAENVRRLEKRDWRQKSTR